jgi:hypothetical protein
VDLSHYFVPKKEELPEEQAKTYSEARVGCNQNLATNLLKALYPKKPFA